jgi:hypothetical protein
VKRACLRCRTGFGRDYPWVANKKELTVSIAISGEQTNDQLLGDTLLLEHESSLDQFPKDNFQFLL